MNGRMDFGYRTKMQENEHKTNNKLLGEILKDIQN